ncbi:MAG: DUF5995 family protein [Caldilineaceae bacterium]
MSAPVDAGTIDDVIAQLDDVIDRAVAAESRLGYFAALYRQVTVAVKHGIETGFFADPARMERLDVIFARRYLDALAQWRAHAEPSGCWAFAFARAASRRPTVLQHLLLGMNAHINLDLGIAAAQTAPGDQLSALYDDFCRINAILADLTGNVQTALTEVWPGLGILLTFVRRSDDVIVNFSMTRAREAAWRVAQQLAPLDDAHQHAVIATLDQQVVARARLIDRPGFTLATALAAIRLRERGSVAEIIAALH